MQNERSGLGLVWGGILIAIVIAIGGYFFPQVQAAFGSTGTRFPNGLSADSTSPSAGQLRGTTLQTTGAATIGSSGTAISRVNTGFCNIWASAATVPASAGATVECAGATNVTALAGVTAGDKVFLSPATTSKSTAGSGLIVVGVSASSTSGFLTVNLYNASSTALTWTQAASSSWQYLVTN